MFDFGVYRIEVLMENKERYIRQFEGTLNETLPRHLNELTNETQSMAVESVTTLKLIQREGSTEHWSQVNVSIRETERKD